MDLTELLEKPWLGPLTFYDKPKNNNQVNDIGTDVLKYLIHEKIAYNTTVDHKPTEVNLVSPSYNEMFTVKIEDSAFNIESVKKLITAIYANRYSVENSSRINEEKDAVTLTFKDTLRYQPGTTKPLIHIVRGILDEGELNIEAYTDLGDRSINVFSPIAETMNPELTFQNLIENNLTANNVHYLSEITKPVTYEQEFKNAEAEVKLISEISIIKVGQYLDDLFEIEDMQRTHGELLVPSNRVQELNLVYKSEKGTKEYQVTAKIEDGVLTVFRENKKYEQTIKEFMGQY